MLQNNLPGTDLIDIVGQAYDQFRTDGRKLGVKRIGFDAYGRLTGRFVRTGTSFWFNDEFVPDQSRMAKEQTYNSMYTPELVRTVYSISAKTHNQYEPLLAAADDRHNFVRDFFYTLSNVDNSNLKVEATDKALAWAPTAVRGSIWNDHKASKAANNARSNHPDDYYTFLVSVLDQAGQSHTHEQTILLDNWAQALSRQDKSDGVYISGAQLTDDADVPIYLITRSQPVNPGDRLSQVGQLIYTAHTDADGGFPWVKLPTFNAPNGFYLIADYAGGDDIYEPRLDPNTFSNIAIIQAPPPVDEPLAFASATLPATSPSPTTPSNPGVFVGPEGLFRPPAATRPEPHADPVRQVSRPRSPQDSESAGRPDGPAATPESRAASLAAVTQAGQPADLWGIGLE